MAGLRHQLEEPFGPFCLPESCDHKWQPWIQHLGQYRCSRCAGFGYTDRKRGSYSMYLIYTGTIIPYNCFENKRRPKCRRIATVHHGYAKFCDRHVPSTDIETAETMAYYESLAREEARTRIANEAAFDRMTQTRREAQ